MSLSHLHRPPDVPPLPAEESSMPKKWTQTFLFFSFTFQDSTIIASRHRRLNDNYSLIRFILHLSFLLDRWTYSLILSFFLPLFNNVRSTHSHALASSSPIFLFLFFFYCFLFVVAVLFDLRRRRIFAQKCKLRLPTYDSVVVSQ